MNRYHATHPDPEIRQKYNEWAMAFGGHKARSQGFHSQTDHDVAVQREKESRKSVQVLLKAVGGQQVKGSKFTANASKKQANKRMRRMQRTGGQRGS